MLRALRLAVIPLTVAVVGFWCVTRALEADRDPAAPAAVGSETVATPVLSARRVPDLLVRPAAQRNLAARLDAFAAANPANSCIAVTEMGADLYGVNADAPLTPASTEKLLTAHASLTTIGADQELETRLVSAAPPVGDTIEGDVWLIGSGDPLVTTEPYRERSSHPEQQYSDLAALADLLTASGVRKITGNVVGDESRYDDQRVVASWPSRFTAQSQAGPLSGLSVDDGFVDDDGILRRSSEPAVSAADAFELLLVERGVAVGRDETAGAAPDDHVVVVSLPSRPVSEIVGQMLTWSDNTTAELLTKELGYRATGLGTTASGVDAIGTALAETGLDRAERVTTDGSGLDAGNRVTCDLLVDVLDAHGPRGPLADGLPVAGETGTLAERFVASPAEGLVRAKTGTLRDVTALAGFVQIPDGEILTFSVVVNTADGQLVDDILIRRQEEVAEILLSWPEGPDRGQLTPR